MGTVPVLKPREVVRTLEKFGWTIARQRGSHIVLTKPGHPATLAVPNHPEVARGTLRSILVRAGIEVSDFIRAL